MNFIFALVCLSLSLMAQVKSFEFDNARFIIDLNQNTETMSYKNKETGEVTELTQDGDKIKVLMTIYQTASYDQVRDLRYIPRQSIKDYFISLVNDSLEESYLIYYGPETGERPVGIKVDAFRVHKSTHEESFKATAQINKVLEFTASDISRGDSSSVRVLGLIYPHS